MRPQCGLRAELTERRRGARGDSPMLHHNKEPPLTGGFLLWWNEAVLCTMKSAFGTIKQHALHFIFAKQIFHASKESISLSEPVNISS